MDRSCRLALALAALLSLTVPAAAADPAAGQRLFKVQCAACHAIVPGKHMAGPSLAGIVGRETGTIEGFHYSGANANAHLVWTPAALDKYLVNPQAIIPGTIMAYPGLRNDTQRADLIAYLETVK
jgi:cytochrome c